jgi:hypothetical protein
MQLYFYSHSINAWHVTKRPLPSTYICTCVVQYNVFKLHVKDIDPCCIHSYLLCEIWSYHSCASKHLNLMACYGLSSKSCRNSCTGRDRPWLFQEFGAPKFPNTLQMNVVRLSTLPPAASRPQEIFPLLISVRNWVDPRARLRPESYVNEKF